ncbi:MAG TPA: CHASE4 domain-containing protein, partial [Armatimonadota bacterium]
MSIRTTTTLILLITIICIVTIYYISSRTILRESSYQQERAFMLDSIQRTEDAFNNELSSMVDKAGDWAAWDETYRFIQDQNKRYIRDNLMDTAFTGLKMNCFIYLDTRGRIVIDRWYDLDR